MSYIDKINRFWKMNREVLFSQWEIVLYMKLLDSFNAVGWQYEIKLSNRQLTFATGLTFHKLIEARNGLVARNLIVFSSGQTKKEISTYSLGEGTLLNTKAESEPAGQTEVPPEKPLVIPVTVRQVMDDFNRICTNMPPVSEAGRSRIDEVTARLLKFDRWKIAEIFRIAAQSDYLNGKNNLNWVASFDWLMKESNLLKVSEGNFNNRQASVSAANASAYEILKNINELE